MTIATRHKKIREKTVLPEADKMGQDYSNSSTTNLVRRRLQLLHVSYPTLGQGTGDRSQGTGHSRMKHELVVG